MDAELIWYLSEGHRRCSELKADMTPISARVLSSHLKELNLKGVINRSVLDTSPPSVEYALTGQGGGLVPAIRAIARMGYKLKHQGGGRPDRT